MNCQKAEGRSDTEQWSYRLLGSRDQTGRVDYINRTLAPITLTAGLISGQWEAVGSSSMTAEPKLHFW